METLSLPGNVIDKLMSYLTSHCSEHVIRYQINTWLNGSDLNPEVIDNANKYVERWFAKKTGTSACKADGDSLEWAHPNLHTTSKGAIMVTPNNLFTILTEHPHFKGRLSYNELTHQPCYNGQPIEDKDYTQLRIDLSSKLRLTFSKSDVVEQAELIALSNKFHPVRHYLQGLRWDGVDRIPALLQALAVDDTPLNREVITRWLISAVARVMQPGCKVDTVLVMKGITGYRKSTAIERLCPEPKWFCNEPFEIGSKEAKQILLGKWIVELAELASLNKRENNLIKADISHTIDEFRSPYDRKPKAYPRQFIYVGTTNEDEFLTDPTSNRRFWVVENQAILDTDAIEAMRDALWAQAHAAYLRGDPWWLDKAGEAAMAERSAQYEQRDAWTDPVLTFLEGKDFVTTSEVLDRIKPCTQDQTNADKARVVKIMQFAKWISGNARRDGKVVWGWKRPGGKHAEGKPLPIAEETASSWN